MNAFGLIRRLRSLVRWDFGGSKTAPKIYNPNGVAAHGLKRDATPLGLKCFATVTQGSSFLATLG